LITSSAASTPAVLAGGSEAELELDRRWRINMMLNKWLDYLFDVGHSLGKGHSPPG